MVNPSSSLPPALPWGNAPEESKPPANEEIAVLDECIEIEHVPQSLEDVGLKIGDRIEVKWEIEKDGQSEIRWWGAVVKGKAELEEDSPGPSPAPADAACTDEKAKSDPFPAAVVANPTATGTTAPNVPETLIANTSEPATSTPVAEASEGPATETVGPATSDTEASAPKASAAEAFKAEETAAAAAVSDTKAAEPESSSPAAAVGPSASGVAGAGEPGSLASVAGLDASWDKDSTWQYDIEYDGYGDFDEKELAAVEFTSTRTLISLEDDSAMLWRVEGDTWDEDDDDELEFSVSNALSSELERVTKELGLDPAQERMAAAALGDIATTFKEFIVAKSAATQEGEPFVLTMEDTEEWARQLKRHRTG
eukprot:gene18502-25000_t